MDSGADQQQPRSDLLPAAIGSLLGLLCFSSSIVAALLSGQSALDGLLTAIAWMVGGYFVGMLLGMASMLSAREFMTAYRDSKPVPDREQPMAAPFGMDGGA